MKAIVNVKSENGLTYQSEFNSIKQAIDYAKESLKVGFNSPLFENAKRKEIYVNVKSNGACKFSKYLHKN
jgi:hypothetical protein